MSKSLFFVIFAAILSVGELGETVPPSAALHGPAASQFCSVLHSMSDHTGIAECFGCPNL